MQGPSWRWTLQLFLQFMILLKMFCVNWHSVLSCCCRCISHSTSLDQIGEVWGNQRYTVVDSVFETANLAFFITNWPSCLSNSFIIWGAFLCLWTQIWLYLIKLSETQIEALTSPGLVLRRWFNRSLSALLCLVSWLFKNCTCYYILILIISTQQMLNYNT